MIKFRLIEKLFYRAEKRRWEEPDELKNLNEGDTVETFINLEFGKLYEKQMPNIDPTNKKIIQRFKQDLKSGLIYDDRYPEDDTEYLDQESKLGKYLIYTKRINGPDRFSYMIYKPVVKLVREGHYRVEIKIVIYSVKDHLKPNGQPYLIIR